MWLAEGMTACGITQAITADLAEGPSTFSGKETEPDNFTDAEMHFYPKF